ncbi:MAG: GTP-binding protein [Holophaga sp.]|nr:GTP-binding protein [Holophaga sp.]
MLEVLMVTGPLGSGKTTVMNRLLKAELGQGRRVAVLINEFGAVSVDGTLVASGRPELADIANLVDGCVCCSLRGDVVTTLAGWCDQPDATRPQRVLLETTGLADPTDLVDLEREPQLAGRMRLAGCLTVISALTPLDHLQRPLLRRQAGLASLVYVSKADLDPSLAMAWESQIRAAFRGHSIQPARMGVPAAAVDPWAGVIPQAPAPEAALPSFTGARALTLGWDHPLDPEALEALFLRPLAQGELLRAKGICAFKDWPARNDGSDRWAFQWADGRLEIAPLPAGPDGKLADRVAVVIGVGLDWAGWKGDLRGLERPPAGARRKVALRPHGSPGPEPC